MATVLPFVRLRMCFDYGPANSAAHPPLPVTDGADVLPGMGKIHTADIPGALPAEPPGYPPPHSLAPHPATAAQLPQPFV